MTTGEAPDRQLASAVAARQQAGSLCRRLETATQHAQETAEALHNAQGKLAGEQGDVDALEHLSWSRILSAMEGSPATDLEREQESLLLGQSPRSRPMSSFMISLEPAQILVTRASRQARATRYSFM